MEKLLRWLVSLAHLGNVILHHVHKHGQQILSQKHKGAESGNYAYGNADFVEYTYDSQGRVICETYEDGTTLTYAYDNTGALATVTDSATGITTRLTSDFVDRNVFYRESGTDHEVSLKYTYNKKNLITNVLMAKAAPANAARSIPTTGATVWPPSARAPAV